MTGLSDDTSTTPPLGLAMDPDGTIAPWVRQAMHRAAELEIDPRRIALALGIPLAALDSSPSEEPHAGPSV